MGCGLLRIAKRERPWNLICSAKASPWRMTQPATQGSVKFVRVYGARCMSLSHTDLYVDIAAVESPRGSICVYGGKPTPAHYPNSADELDIPCASRAPRSGRRAIPDGAGGEIRPVLVALLTNKPPTSDNGCELSDVTASPSPAQHLMPRSVFASCLIGGNRSIENRKVGMAGSFEVEP